MTGAVASFATLDRLVPDVATDGSTYRVALTLLGGFVLATSLTGRPRVFSPRRHQVWRHTAQRRIVGVPLFGFLLGLGWWTVVSSSLLWVALIVAALNGHGLEAGLAFGAGRAFAFWLGAVAPSGHPGLERAVEQLLSQWWRATWRIAGGLAGAAMIAASLTRATPQ